ncbi:MAG: Rho termination factor N-terminal domain-containing protein, partial [Phycisphaerae bacterium]|nr:Rho termination factor N-terminal domain-containing protein [Phycisphaerae bacterium]
MSKRRRRRKGGPGGHSGNHQQHAAVISTPGALPTDEQLEIELQELEKELKGKYDVAKRDDLTLGSLQKMTGEELVKMAKKEGLEDQAQLPKQQLVFEILKARAQKQGLMMSEGTLEIMQDGFGFLRSAEYSYQPSADDVYVSPSQIRRFGLRKGHVVKGIIRPPKDQEVYFALLRVDTVNGRDPKVLHDLPTFENLTPLHPNRRIHLEDITNPTRIEPRIIEMVTPLGFGQRALIVAPPRTGKTVILQQLALAI